MKTFFIILFGQLYAATYPTNTPKFEAQQAISGTAMLHATKAPNRPQSPNFSPKDTVYVLGGGWGVLRNIKLNSKPAQTPY